MFNTFKKILVLAPHTDDAELGCGGAIVKFLEEKKQVFCAVFSTAEKSLAKNLPKNILKTEVRQAVKALGLPLENLILFHYIVRDFPQYRQAILEEMVQLNKKLKPDLILLPSTYDTHQDHQVISQEGFRAFKMSSILGYELPWNNLTFNTSAFILLKPKHLAKKLRALACYRSQSERVSVSKDFIKSLAITRGRQIGSRYYAEAFEIIRLIIK